MRRKCFEVLRWPSVQYVLLSAIASGINYLTNILYGRMLTTEEYGIAATMLAFVSNICVFMSPMQMTICTLIAGKQKSDDNLNDAIIISCIINFVTVLCMGIFEFYLRRYLSIRKVSDYIIVIIAVLFVNLFTMATGIVQGQQKYIMLGMLMIGAYGIKIAVSVPLVKNGVGPIASMIGGSIGWFVCALIVIIENWDKAKDNLAKLRLHVSKENILYYLWSLVLLIVVSAYMNSGDLLIGNVYNSKEIIGLYSVASTVAKISVFLIATPISSILLPKLVTLNNSAQQQKKLIAYGELIVVVGMFIYGVLINWKGKEIICFLYGNQYAQADVYILPATIFAIIEGVFYTFYQYKVARGKLRRFTIVTVLLGGAGIVCSLLMKLPIQHIVLVLAGAMMMSIVISLLLEKNE